jgi:hypothetical protein
MVVANPALWEQVKRDITSGSKGGRPGQWSAIKALLSVKEYKKRGGTYSGSRPKDGITQWVKEKWRTKSGLPSRVTGERFLPTKAIQALTPEQYERTSMAKIIGTTKGKQYVPQPEDVKEITSKYQG